MHFFIALIFLFFFSSSAQAMSCYRPENAVKHYDLVFKGKVLSTVTLEIPPFSKDMQAEGWTEEVYRGWVGESQVTKFQVIESYKGRAEAETEIFHQSESVFGTSYKQGEIYIIYADKDEKGRNSSGGCSSSFIVSELGKEDKYFSENFVELEIFRSAKTVYNELIEEYPKNAYLYLQQGKFFENYDDYNAAEESYRKGLLLHYKAWLKEKGVISKVADNLDSNWWVAIEKNDFVKSYGRAFFSSYGRALFKQEKYEESLTPLKFAGDFGEGMRLVSLIKLKRFDDIKNLPLNMRFVELDELDLSGLNLRSLDLSRSKIKKLILDRTNLEESDFSGADIKNMEVKSSVLIRAKFKDSSIGGFIEDGNFSGSDFSKAKVYFDHVSKADFSGANFSKTKFVIHNHFHDVDFTDALYDRDTDWVETFSQIPEGAKLVDR